MRVVVDINALILPITCPWINRNIGNRVGFAGNVRIIFQLTIQYPINTLGLIGLTIDSLLNFLGGVEAEVVVLSKHGAKTTHLEH